MAGGAAEPVRGTVSRASGLLILVLVGVLVVAVATVLWMWWRVVTFAHPVDYGEGPLLQHALRLASGQPVYVIPGATPPWTVVNYPPIYPLVNAGLSELFGPAYWYGRLLSMLAAGAAATFAGLIVVALTDKPLAALITALLVPVIPYLGFWAALARVDALALALSLAGLWCVVRQPRSNRWLIAAGVLLVAAGFTRQTYLLTAPLTSVVWLWPFGRRRALVFAGAVAVSVVAIGLAVDLTTAGGFWFNVVTANVNAWDWDTLSWYAEDVARTLPVLLAALLVALPVSVRGHLPWARVLVPYSAGAVVVALTAGKVGSSLNYLLELGTACCLAAGLLLAALSRRPRLQVVALVGLLGQVVGLLVWPHLFYGLLRSTVDDTDAAQRVAAVVAGSSGPVLADEDLGYLPPAGRPIELQPFELSQLAYAGVWDQGPLLQAIESRRYPVILIYTNDETPPIDDYRWTPEMRAAINRSYAVTESIPRQNGRTLVHRPR